MEFAIVNAVFFYIVLIFVVAIGAKFGRNRSAIGWFILSVLFSPVLMLLLLCLLPVKKRVLQA